MKMSNNGYKYKHASVDNAIKLLRPGAKVDLYNNTFLYWEHEEDPPTEDEINNMIKMIQEWEDNNPELVDKVYV
jgi:hypothetical protein